VAVLEPPIEPMLAKLVDDIPDGPFLFEPKWDGFRAIVFRSMDDVYIQSRDLKPLNRYFPELHEALLARLPPGCVVDGEVVIATPQGLDFDTLQLRLHPAASRVAKLARACPSSFVGFDVLAVDGESICERPQRERRASEACSRSSTREPRTAWSRDSAGTRTAAGWWDRSCSGFSTPRGCSITLASPRHSR
jgi:ATP-dependent DNA ligase